MSAASVCSVGGLYVHVPFCARKCAYCGFYSEVGDVHIVERYVSALIREMERIGAGSFPETIFFGGGTPSVLSEKQWERILGAMERLKWLRGVEWTIECNPATVSLEKARLWREAGVNRISLGVQSFDGTVLEQLGRVHTQSMVFESFDLLRGAGFGNVNLDLMFAVPGQTLGSWRRTLDEALALESEHLACYEVIYEEDTPLFERVRSGLSPVSEDIACRMYEALLERTQRHGLIQYEVANFAWPKARTGGSADPVGSEIPWYACRHNINYWRGGPYQGLGPSAAGYTGGRRYKNVADTARYCELVEEGQAPVAWVEELAPLARAGEIAAFGLRMNSGWPYALFEQRTGYDLRRQWAGALEELKALGWAECGNDGFRLTPLGMRFADAAAERFL